MSNRSYLDRFDHLISRKLDGEATPADEAEFDRLLTVESDFRRIWEDASRVDRLSDESLQWAVEAGLGPQPVLMGEPPRRSSFRWTRPVKVSLGISAAAAAVAAALFVGLGTTPDVAKRQTWDTPVAGRGPIDIAPPGAVDRLIRPAIHERSIGEDRVGIIDGNRLYLLTFDRHRVGMTQTSGQL
jgi:anti-sigma factor RsiW